MRGILKLPITSFIANILSITFLGILNKNKEKQK
jgi:hypothetical protein